MLVVHSVLDNFMIDSESVLATKDSFVVVNKINKPQLVRGFKSSPTMLVKVMDGKSQGIWIETEHYSIIASPNQKFIISDTEYMEAINLTQEQSLLTYSGFEEIKEIIPLSNVIPMTGIFTASKVFIANSFVLLSDF